MDTVALSDTLRVNDYDANQYTIEKKTTVEKGDHTGDVRWTPVAYCGSNKSLPLIARRIVAGEIATTARQAAERAFDASGIAEKLEALPPKTGRAKQKSND